MKNCELCDFKNPKGAATAAIIKYNKLLVLRRNEEPYKGVLDLPGGFMSAKEVPEKTIYRELKEELGVDAALTFMAHIPGTAKWKEEVFPIIGSFYLADIGDQKIKLNVENTEYEWISLSEVDPNDMPYDSNKEFVTWLKKEFTFDLKTVHELVAQLDSSATVNEQSLYQAKLNGYLSTRYDKEKLVGMGWIYPRQTMLRKQAVVEDMIVHESQRGKGLGYAILDDLIKWAKEEGVEMIELTSNPKRVAANELYKKYGFKLHPTNHYLYAVE